MYLSLNAKKMMAFDILKKYVKTENWLLSDSWQGQHFALTFGTFFVKMALFRKK